MLHDSVVWHPKCLIPQNGNKITIVHHKRRLIYPLRLIAVCVEAWRALCYTAVVYWKKAGLNRESMFPISRGCAFPFTAP